MSGIRAGEASFLCGIWAATTGHWWAAAVFFICAFTVFSEEKDK